MDSGTTLISIVVGLLAGMALSYGFRRWRQARKGPQPAAPAVYTSRQAARKAAREQRKRR